MCQKMLTGNGNETPQSSFLFHSLFPTTLSSFNLWETFSECICHPEDQ